ncbi:MAG: polyhydroxyalkanoic acid system family protein [Chromatiales bacterium]|jgi:putative polyhydroxyalkanoate system protein
MSHIHIKRPHQLDKPALREHVEQLAAKLAQDYDYDYHWEGDKLKFKRSGAQGHIALADDHIVVDIKLGLLLSAVRGQVESTLNSYLDKYLA